MRLALTLTYFKRWNSRGRTHSLYETPEQPFSVDAVMQEIREQLEAILDNRRIDQGKVTVTITAGE